MNGPPPWVRDYGFIPYRRLGRDRSGVDCWGLVRLVLEERFGRPVPSFATLYPRDADGPMLSARADEAVPMMHGWAPAFGEPHPGDIARIRYLGQDGHVGLVVASGWLLHTFDSTGVRIEPLVPDSGRWRVSIGPVVKLYRAEGSDEPGTGPATQPCVND